MEGAFRSRMDEKKVAWVSQDAWSIPFLEKVGPLRDREDDKLKRSFGFN